MTGLSAGAPLKALRIPNAALRFRPPAGVSLPPAPLSPLAERAVAAPAPDDDPFPANFPPVPRGTLVQIKTAAGAVILGCRVR